MPQEHTQEMPRSKRKNLIHALLQTKLAQSKKTATVQVKTGKTPLVLSQPETTPPLFSPQVHVRNETVLFLFSP